MNAISQTGIVTVATLLAGCAELQFSNGGLTYYDPVPALLVSTTCDSEKPTVTTTTATVLVLPGTMRTLKLKNGFGSSNLNATLSNGMITSVGQESDSKIPDTLTAIAGLGVFGAQEAMGKPRDCMPEAKLYQITQLEPDKLISLDRIEIPEHSSARN
jgi:hypothetical protein